MLQPRDYRWSLLSIGLLVGCDYRTSEVSVPPRLVPDVDQLARSAAPNELKYWIRKGELDCGGPEGVALLQAALALKTGDFDSSLQYAANVSPQGPHRSTALWIAGEAIYRSGDLLTSMNLLKSLAAESPDDLAARRCLAAIYYDVGAMSQAEEELRNLIRLAPRDFRPHHLLGRIHLDFRKYGSAVEHYRTALDLCPPQGPRQELERGLAAALRGDRRFEELLAWLSTDRPDSVLQTSRADALWSTGHSQEARTALDVALKNAPKLPDALLLASRIDADEGQVDQAIEGLRTLLKDNPHDVAARHQLAILQQQTGDLAGSQETMQLRDASQALMDQLVELNQQAVDNLANPGLCDQIAEVCQKLGKQELAASWRRAASGLRASTRN